MIVGIDEVGRGCWAGPLVAGAVALGQPISGLNDSKLLSKKRREQLDAHIRVQAAAFGLGWVAPAEIDEHGLAIAVHLAMERALAVIDAEYEEVVIDGSINFLSDNPLARAEVKADVTVPAVSAASILAKVARDRYMSDIALQFPGYGFDKHVGYGVRAHALALQQFGVCELHRRSFKPVKAVLV